jgi:hypothetical protein
LTLQVIEIARLWHNSRDRQFSGIFYQVEIFGSFLALPPTDRYVYLRAAEQRPLKDGMEKAQNECKAISPQFARA